MTVVHAPDGRLRAYAQFLAGLFYIFLARALAHRVAIRFPSDDWSSVVEQVVLVLVLIAGFAGMGFALNRQQHPIRQQGLPARAGWLAEAGIGLILGWGVVLLCAAVLAIVGGITIRLHGRPWDWVWFLADLLFFAFAALAEEIAFRGYPFQRFARAVGPTGAVLGFSLLYAFLMAVQTGSTQRVSLAIWFLLSVLLSTAYLRSRALWVSWGLNFGWKASRALLFGLAVNGDTGHNHLVQGDPTGPFWLTGAGFGLEGSWLAFVVLLLALPALYSATRELDFRYNAPEFYPAGIPVDLDAAARQQHETAMNAPPAPAPLVQIAPIAPSGAFASPPPSIPPKSGNESS